MYEALYFDLKGEDTGSSLFHTLKLPTICLSFSASSESS